MNNCLCGCGTEIKPGKKYVYGHQRRGQKLSEEHKAKLLLANKGKNCSEETKRKLSLASSGENCSEEIRRKRSVAISGENNPNFGKNLSGENGPNFGKHFSEETKAKMSQANSGKNNPNWQGGIQYESYGLGNDEELKELIRIRDNYTCQQCNKVWVEGERLFVAHHIDYDKNNHISWNRISLCCSCHAKTNTNREYWIKLLYKRNFENCIKRIALT